eukprot:COSAG02_NODE_1525_length_12107_cov_333.322618_4_plen_119_part_00
MPNTQEARHRIELLSTELSNAKENAAREASRYGQTTEMTTMLREAHTTLVATNDRLRKDYDALHNRYNMDADQWKVRRTFTILLHEISFSQRSPSESSHAGGTLLGVPEKLRRTEEAI